MTTPTPPAIFWKGTAEFAILANTFAVLGVPTDPTAVSLIITDPTGTQTTQVWPAGNIVRDSAGVFHYNQAATLDGLWSYVWIGTGAVSDQAAGTFTVTATSIGNWYTSKEELKARLDLQQTDVYIDDQLLLAVAAASSSVERYCGRFFYRQTATQVYSPNNIEILAVNDFVSLTSIAVDTNGQGLFSQVWAPGDYRIEPANALTAKGEPWPYTQIRALAAGGGRYFFPWVFPMSNPDRVQITATWGWPAVPYLVKQATLQLAADLYALKGAPFGVAGFAEFGVVRIKQNPQIEMLLHRYIRGQSKVGT